MKETDCLTQDITRRDFLKAALTAGALCSFPIMCSGSTPAPAGEKFVREARYYDKLKETKIQCRLCPHECRVADLERGTCGVRENRGGTYYTLVYGNPCSAHIDPIEKKPMYHYYPATNALSIATVGCNFVCRFCQNWEISQKRPEQVKSGELFPKSVIRVARQKNCKTVAHTYTEPVIFFEYMLECAIEGKKNGIPNVMISNGFIRKEPMKELCKYLGAVKIDLKAFTEKFYKEMCGGSLKPVLDTLVLLRQEKVWFEIVVLLIPTLNDSQKEIHDMTKWIVKELGGNVPIHFLRYSPTFMLKNLPPTPPEVLNRSRKIALNNGVKFVYVGNVYSDSGNTYCPGCGKLMIERVGFTSNTVGMKGNRCKYCNDKIPGVFN